MSISASSVTLAAWSSSWWGFPAEAVKVYSLSYSSLGGTGSLSLVVGPPRWPQAKLTGAGSVKRKSNGLCAW